MGILKILSRGTKKASKTAYPGQDAPVKLPSAGTQTNPQFFHDGVRGQKRKRHGGEPDTEPTIDLPEVDFFAAKGNSVGRPVAPRPASPSPVAARPAETLSRDECRQILRSHRLKFTLMLQPEHRGQEGTSKKKSRQAGFVDATATEKRQLYPQPLNSFGELRSTYDISRRVAKNVAAQGYRVPTEVQLGALPLLLRPELALRDENDMKEGVDFLAVAPTGSGKTMSFLIPAINSIMRRRAQGKLRGIHELEAVIVVPTRELVHQLVNKGQELTRGTGLVVLGMKKSTALYPQQPDPAHDSSDVETDSSDDQDAGSGAEDGVAKKKPRRAAKVDILVTTPLLLSRAVTSSLGGTVGPLVGVRELVLDEADVLLDPLFREQTLGIWTACANPGLRVTCWSATMGSNIEALVAEQTASRSQALSTAPRPLVRLVVGLKDTAVPNIVHKLTYAASEQGKFLALRQLLRRTSNDDSATPLRPPFLIFTQTIERASALHEELKYDIPLEAGGPWRVAALHSDLSDSARAATMRRFRAGEIWVLITTDVLARGVDFAGVNGVVNYDIPGSSAVYVHRAGRTGRAGREGGMAVTLYTKDDIPFVKTVANVIAASEKQAGRTGNQAGVQKWLLDALPDVAKADRKRVKERGVESRRSGRNKARITSKSGYERRKEHNRRGAIEGSQRRMAEEGGLSDEDDGKGEWTGFGD